MAIETGGTGRRLRQLASRVTRKPVTLLRARGLQIDCSGTEKIGCADRKVILQVSRSISPSAKANAEGLLLQGFPVSNRKRMCRTSPSKYLGDLATRTCIAVIRESEDSPNNTCWLKTGNTKLL